ncbi:MAG: hypothetical protein A2Y74_00455 [Actinobacteria bacterium RBG_13_63_9]|nr:MAG: hypothetical protein A2Y74_00455 [Actinobacteria bacterium RBG_13_63_9]
MIAILLLLVFLGGASSSAADGPRVRIVNSDGTLFGVLHLSKGGEALSLTQPNGSNVQVGRCANEEKMKVSSPDGTLHALVFERNCGATVDFASRVVLADARGQKLLVVLEGRPQISLVWKEGRRLEVHQSKMSADQVYHQVAQAREVTVVFVPDLRPVEASKYLDFASFNYGATGRAAGMPREFLLRLAGWSQEASGLHRSEWGSWAGPAPYGDDPRGRAKVMDGIQYDETMYRPKK